LDQLRLYRNVLNQKELCFAQGQVQGDLNQKEHCQEPIAPSSCGITVGTYAMVGRMIRWVALVGCALMIGVPTETKSVDYCFCGNRLSRQNEEMGFVKKIQTFF